MSWQKVKGICFGCLRVDPEDLKRYRFKDLWSMLKGWDDHEMFNLAIQRKVAIIISETVNRSMGGKGVADQIMKAFELPNDKPSEFHYEWTSERITEKIRLYNEMQAAKRKAN